MAVSGHKNEASILSYSKTNICTKKMSETLTTRCELSQELSVMNSHQSSPVLSLSQEEVIAMEPPERLRRQRIVPREEWRMRKNSLSALKSVSVRCKVYKM